MVFSAQVIISSNFFNGKHADNNLLNNKAKKVELMPINKEWVTCLCHISFTIHVGTME